MNESASGTKVCTRCKIGKPLADFFSRKASPDGKQPICKFCDQEKRKSRRDADPESARNYDQEYRQQNLEKRRAKDRAYFLSHKGEFIVRAKAWYAANKAEHLAKSKAWREENAGLLQQYKRDQRADPDTGNKIRARRRQHYRDNKPAYLAQARAREKHIALATPPWADMKAIEAIYAECAAVTERTGIQHHVDHVVPLRGKLVCGLHVPQNLQVLPWAENLRKGNTVQPEEKNRHAA